VSREQDGKPSSFVTRHRGFFRLDGELLLYERVQLGSWLVFVVGLCSDFTDSPVLLVMTRGHLKFLLIIGPQDCSLWRLLSLTLFSNYENGGRTKTKRVMARG